MTPDPRRSLDVPPAPVRGPRRDGRRGLLAAIAVLGGVAAAIGIASVAPVRLPPRASIALATVVPSPAAVAATDAGRTPDPSEILAATTPRMSRDAFAAAVRDGTLDGRLVFIDGVPRAGSAACNEAIAGLDGCVDLAIPGLGLEVRQGAGAIPWHDPPPGAWLVAVVRAGGLTYLGSLVPRPTGTRMPVAAVARDEMPDSEGTLFEADGYLVQNPVHTCFRPDAGATPCPPPPPFLARDEPLPDGTRISDAGATVSVAPDAVEVDPGLVVTPGTFLIQRDPHAPGGVQVVARYVPSRAVRVLVP